MTLNVLAVDDSRTMRDMLSMALTGAGFSAVLAEDGEKGLDALKEGQFDAIITDINMPNMDGFSFIGHVRGQDQFKSIPILVLTTEAAPELKAKARNAGATGWVVKPFDPPKLVRALQLVAG